jgi:hypothetical protein
MKVRNSHSERKMVIKLTKYVPIPNPLPSMSECLTSISIADEDPGIRGPLWSVPYTYQGSLVSPDQSPSSCPDG